MAKKDSLTYEGFNFDDSLDYQFDDNFGQKPKARGPRQAVTDFTDGAYEGFKGSLKDSSAIKNTLKQSLPRPFKESWDAFDTASNSVGELYDHAEKEIGPILESVTKKIDGLVPESMTTLKEFTSWVKNKFGREPGYKARDYDEESIQNIVSETFAKMAELDEARSEQESKEDMVRDLAAAKIQKDQHNQTAGWLSRMDKNIHRYVRYQEMVGQPFQKKSLEINIRQLLTQQHMLREIRESRKEQSALLKDIGTNTGLPDFVKITKTERFKESLLNRTIGGVQDRMFGEGSAFNTAMKRMVADGKAALDQAKMATTLAAMGLDQAEGLKDAYNQGMLNPAEMVGQEAGKWVGSKIRDKVLKNLVDKLQENEDFMKTGYDVGNIVRNPKEFFEWARNNEKFKKVLDSQGRMGDGANKAFSYLESLFAQERGRTSVESTSFGDANQPAMYNRRSETSLVKVIPAYLARILQQVTMANKPGKEVGLLLHDPFTGELRESNAVKQTAENFLRDAFKDSTMLREINNVSDNIKEMTGTEEDPKVLQRVSHRLITEFNAALTSNNIRKSKMYKDASDAEKVILDKIAEAVSGDNLETSKKRYGLNASLDEARTQSTSLGASIQKLMDEGLESHLVTLGIVKRDKSGKYYMDMDKITEFQRETLIKSTEGSSDIHVKDSIESVNGKDSLSKLRKIPVKIWEYIRGKRGQKAQGPMAQEVNRQFGDEVAPNGTKIDMMSMNGVLMSSVQQLADQQDQMRQEMKGGGLEISRPIDRLFAELRGIRMGVNEVNETIKSKNMFGLPGFDFKDVNIGETLAKAFGAGKQGFDNLREKTSDLAEPLVRTGNQLFDSLQSVILTSISRGLSLGGRGLKGAWDATKEIGDFVRGSMPFGKEDVQKQVSELISFGLRGTKKLINVAYQTVFEHIPNFLKDVGAAGKELKKRTKMVLNGPRDVYIRGQSSPALLAQRMRAGMYVNAETGETINHMDDLIRAKADIIDASTKEVALRWSDTADGLFDQDGNEIRTMRGHLLNIGIGAVSLGLKGAKKLFDGAGSLAKSGSSAFDSVKSMFSSAFGSLGKMGGLSFVDARQLGLLAQIRDLVAWGKPEKVIRHVYNRDLKAEQYLSGQDFLATLFDDKFKDLFQKDNQSSSGSTGSSDSKDSGGPGFSTEATPWNLDNLFANTRAALEKARQHPEGLRGALRDKFAQVEGSDDFVGPVHPDSKKSWFGRTMSRIKNRFTKKKDATQSEEGEPARGRMGRFFDKFKFWKRRDQAAEPGMSTDLVQKDFGDDWEVTDDMPNAHRFHRGYTQDQLGGGQLRLGMRSRASRALGVEVPRLSGPSSTALTVQNPREMVAAGNKEPSKDTSQVIEDAIIRSEKSNQSLLKNLIAQLKGLFRSNITPVTPLGGMGGGAGPAMSTVPTSGGTDMVPAGGASVGRFGRMWNRGRAMMGGFAGKAMSMLPMLGNMASGIGGMLGNLLGGPTAERGGPVDSGSAYDYSSGPSQLAIRGPRDGNKTNDSDGDGFRDNGMVDIGRRQQEENQRRNEEIKKKAEQSRRDALNDSYRYKTENAIDSLIKQAGGVLDFLKTGAGGLFELLGAGGLIGKAGSLLKRGFSALRNPVQTAKGLWSRGGSLAARGGGMFTKAAAAIRGGGIVQTGMTALRGAQIAGLATGTMTGTLLAGAATAGKAALAILASPIFVKAAVVGAVGYGLYKGYKYFTRNKLDDYQKLRAVQYGLNEDSEELYRVMALERYLEDGKLIYQGPSVTINPKALKPEELLEIMDIGKDDEERAGKFTAWFGERFLPFFLKHASIVNGLNNKVKLNGADGAVDVAKNAIGVKTLTAVDKLAPEDLKKYLEEAKIPDGPYGVDVSPFKTVDFLPNTFAEASKMADALISKVKIKKSDKKTLSDTVKENTKQTEAKKEAEKKSEKIDDYAKAIEESKKLAAERAAERERLKSKMIAEVKSPGLPPAERGEDAGQKPNDSAASDKNQGMATQPSITPNVAPGNLMPPNEGINFVALGPDAVLQGLNPKLYELLMGMATEYNQLTGKKLPINEAFRSYERQMQLYKSKPQNAAKPGSSMHERGLAIDIPTETANSLEKLGLMRKYGFTRPVGGETWHVEPAGIQFDVQRAKSDVSWANTMIAASPGRGGGGYGMEPGSAKLRRNPLMAKAMWESGRERVVTAANDPNKTGAPEAANDPKMAQVPGASGGQGTQVAQATSGQATGAQTPSGGSTPTPSRQMPAEVAGRTASEKQTNQNVAAGREGIREKIQQASQKAGVDPNTMLLFAAAESSMGKNMNATTSRAKGVYQFIPTTWNEVTSKHGAKYGLDSSASPYDPEASTYMAAEYMKSNGYTDIYRGYLAHLLGPTGARRFLSTPDNMPAAQRFRAQANANRAIFFTPEGKERTIGEIRELLIQKFEKLAKDYGINVDIRAAAGVSGGQTGSTGPKSENTATAGTGSGTDVAKATQSTAPAAEKYVPTAAQNVAIEEKAAVRNQMASSRKPDTATVGNVAEASGIIPLLQRSNDMEAQLLKSVNEGVVPILTGIQQTLEKMYQHAVEKKSPASQGGSSNPGAGAPSTNQRPQRQQTVEATGSALDRQRRYG